MSNDGSFVDHSHSHSFIKLFRRGVFTEFTHADDSRVSYAFSGVCVCVSVCMSVSLCVFNNNNNNNTREGFPPEDHPD